jgi:hypothetical protein
MPTSKWLRSLSRDDTGMKLAHMHRFCPDPATQS